MLDKKFYQEGFEGELCKFLSQYCSENPELFVRDRDSRDRILAKFESDMTIMRDYPNVIHSMWTKLGETAPEHLRVEGQKTASAQREKTFGLPSNRKSLGIAELVGEDSHPVF